MHWQISEKDIFYSVDNNQTRKFTSSMRDGAKYSFTIDWQAERNIINILHHNPESQILIFY